MDIRTFLFVLTMNKSSMNISHDYISCVCVCVVFAYVHVCVQVCLPLYTQIVKIVFLSLNLEHTVSHLVWQSASANGPSVLVCPAVPGLLARVATSGFLCRVGI